MTTTAPPASNRHRARRLTAKYSRWLHIYGSMVSFAVVFFFSITGLTLNHPQWFASRQRTATVTGALNTAWTATPGGVDVKKLEIIEFLRATHHIQGAMSDFRVDDQEADVSFKGPGYSADILIDRASGKYELTENRMGFVAVMNDLHKGRDAGGVWKWLIDISAVLLVFVSLTGLILIWFIHKKRAVGLMLLATGVVATYLTYVIWAR